MKNFKKLSLLLSAFALVTASLLNVACSDDDDPEPDPDKLTLTASPKSILNTGTEYATFVVKFNDTDVTAQAKIFDQNNDQLSEARFTSTVPGTYTFRAEYNDLTATETVIVTEEDDPGFNVTEITLDADKLQILADGDDAATFTIGSDVEEAIPHIKVINKATNQPVGTSFSSDEEGEFVFFAQYGDVKSNEIIINTVAETSGSAFYPNVAMIRFTNTGCPPCHAYATNFFPNRIQPTLGDHYVEMAVHADSPSPADPYKYGSWRQYANTLGIQLTGIPDGTFDMRWVYLGLYLGAGTISGNQIQIDQAEMNTRLESLVNDKVSDVGFKVVSSVSGNLAEISVTVKASSAGNYTLFVGLLEDGIVGPQVSSNGTNLTNYVHNNTLRQMVTPVTGDALGEIAADATVEKTYSLALNAGWVTNNCKLFVYATKTVDGNTLINNATYAVLKGTTPYRYE